MATGFLSPWHVAIFALVVLLVFGPKKLPVLGRTLGKGLREFNDAVNIAHTDEPEDASRTLAAAPARAAVPSDRDRDLL